MARVDTILPGGEYISKNKFSMAAFDWCSSSESFSRRSVYRANNSNRRQSRPWKIEATVVDGQSAPKGDSGSEWFIFRHSRLLLPYWTCFPHTNLRYASRPRHQIQIGLRKCTAKLFQTYHLHIISSYTPLVPSKTESVLLTIDSSFWRIPSLMMAAIAIGMYSGSPSRDKYFPKQRKQKIPHPRDKAWIRFLFLWYCNNGNKYKESF